jgi:hypothetical protein
MATITVLSPVGRTRTSALTLPGLPPHLEGLRVGFLDNTKSNFDRLVLDMGAVLRERFGVREIVHRRKANAATPAADDIVAGLAKDCDLVFAGSAD